MADGDQRTAILSTSVMFVMGLLLLIPVNIARGRKTAQQAE
jgi:UMF1 family MFS transporter